MQVLTRWSWGLPESRQNQVRRGLVGVLLVIVVLWAGYGLLAGDAGLLRIMSLNRRAADLQAEVARLESETRALQKRRDLLLSDPASLEKIAREEYGLARAGEVVYRFDSEAPTTGSLAALYPDSTELKADEEAKAKPSVVEGIDADPVTGTEHAKAAPVKKTAPTKKTSAKKKSTTSRRPHRG